MEDITATEYMYQRWDSKEDDEHRAEINKAEWQALRQLNAASFSWLTSGGNSIYYLWKAKNFIEQPRTKLMDILRRIKQSGMDDNP